MEPPAEFPFPFTPYAIQEDFMRNLYQAIENGKIGIFESPTGTGKSMSLICGTLTWLRDYEKKRSEELQQQASAQTSHTSTQESGECDWVSDFISKQENNKDKLKAETLLQHMQRRNETLKRLVKSSKSDSIEPQRKRSKYSSGLQKKDETLMLLEQAKRELDRKDRNLSDEENDCDLLLEDYNSDDDSDLFFKHDGNEETDDNSENDILRIYYCSRTHSQLTQFIKEIQKSPFNNLSSDDFLSTVAALASRQSLCINESVRKHSSVQQMNDKCLDLQKSPVEKQPVGEKVKKKKSACPFKTMNSVDNLSNQILGKIQDIEELVSHGKELTACPYYAARQAATMAQIVVVPYQILIHSATRQASGIKLKDSVVIIDEAHNLVDTIANIHSVEVSFSQVQKSFNQLTQYLHKFSKRLKAENLMYVKRLLFILRKLLMVMGFDKAQPEFDAKGTVASKPVQNLLPDTIVMKVHDFLFKASLDNLNLFKVLRYCERSFISRKLNGFVERYAVSGSVEHKCEQSSLSTFLEKSNKTELDKHSLLRDGAPQAVMRSPLMHIESFLLCLTSSNEDGRIAITTADKTSSVSQSQLRSVASIKYLLLNPATHFKDIVEECRSVIVAGGTMQPCSSFVNQLLTPIGVPKERIFEFSCGHVIGKDQLLPVILTQGPSGAEFEFTFGKRKNLKLIDELGRSVCNLCNIIPGGIISFFPSYEYENVVYSRWDDTGILKRIQAKKKVFRESRKSGPVDQVLQDYSSTVKRTKSVKTGLTGALLLSVVGGKMSEGINFSDDLGRCIIMVGLPYPNMYSAELKEKMAYLDSNMPNVGSKSAGQSYYENLCMKAVNQSIGRAIRHRDDYASIILVDRRYSGSDIQSQLPGWISSKLLPTGKFGATFGAVRKFFMAKKNS